MITQQLDIAYLEYANNILYVRVQEGLILDKRDMERLLKAAIEMVKGEKYYALIDTSSNANSTTEAREYYSKSEYSKYRFADAFVVDSLPMRLMVNFYIKINQPLVRTKMFGTVKEAVQWLEGLKTLQLH
jgi:hypothetical protein